MTFSVTLNIMKRTKSQGEWERCTVKESFSEEVAFEERLRNDLCKDLDEEYSKQRKQQIPKFANRALEHRCDVHSFSKYLFSKYLLSTVTLKYDLTDVLNVIGFMFQKNHLGWYRINFSWTSFERKRQIRVLL